eukprot:COSAG05_NODE_141_length_16655_cov_22.580963_7_plen_163_part_00
MHTVYSTMPSTYMLRVWRSWSHDQWKTTVLAGSESLHAAACMTLRVISGISRIWLALIPYRVQSTRIADCGTSSLYRCALRSYSQIGNQSPRIRKLDRSFESLSPTAVLFTLLPYQQDRVLKKTRNIFTLLVIVFSSLHTLLSRGHMRAICGHMGVAMGARG